MNIPLLICEPVKLSSSIISISIIHTASCRMMIKFQTFFFTPIFTIVNLLHIDKVFFHTASGSVHS